MRKLRHRPPDEVRVIIDKKLDDMQYNSMTKEQRKAWNRKPYQLRSKQDDSLHEN